MVLDCAGNIYLAAGREEAGGIFAFTPEGEQADFLPIPGSPTNCTFGGPDLKTLYVTSGGAVYSVACEIPGHLAYPKPQT